jgi:PAS domain S-box-containing protein
MFTIEFHVAVGEALKQLATGAPLAEVLGMLVRAGEIHGMRAGIVTKADRSWFSVGAELPRALRERIDAVDLDRESLLVIDPPDPQLGARTIWVEPITSPSGGLGAFVMFRPCGEELPPAERSFSLACAHLAGIALEKKRREDEFLHRESQINAVLEAAIDAIITIDHRGIVESFNHAAEKMFGYDAGEVIGGNVSMLMTGANARDHDSYIRRYLETGERRIIGIGREVVGKKKDGTLFPMELGVSEVRLGDVRKFTGIIRDLTVRKRFEAQMRQSQKLEAVGTLAAGVSHDFNNLLMGIMGCTSIAMTKLPKDSPARVFLEEAKAAGERGTKLTRQLLAFSRRVPAEVRPLAINDVVTGTEVMLRRLIPEEIDLVTDLVDTGGPIRGDVGQIEQVIVNLVVNARDAIEGSGRIIIRTRERPIEHALTGATGTFVVLEVEDDGSGMDPQTQSRIFEPFFTTKGPDRGTGLGLSTVYGIVERHGGFVDVESALGVGTTLRTYFPKQEDEEAIPRPPLSSRPQRGGESVLVVEDDRLVRLAIIHFLRGAGYRVTEAASGAEALELMKRDGPPDLLLTDLIMPDMNGLELLNQAREVYRDLTALFMSGYMEPEKIARLHAEGVAFIEKPFAEEVLSKKLREVLD